MIKTSYEKVNHVERTDEENCLFSCLNDVAENYYLTTEEMNFISMIRKIIGIVFDGKKIKWSW